MTKLYTDYAELYDILFDWDIEEEVDWLFERLGRPTSVLEPGCGSGRMLDSFARRGVEVVGFDLSPQMLELARERLGDRGKVSFADMTEFDLGRAFAGAVSPINTLLHLSPEQLARHFDCMARHLEPGGSYLVQVGLIDEGSYDPFANSHWEASRDDTKLRGDWSDEEIDFELGVSRQRSRIEVLEGPRAGEVIEEIHDMTLWTPETWATAISSSPFREVATYDAGKKGERPRVDQRATGGLLWHQLVPTA
jgi:SAM-dependent methyltransferase